MKRNFDKNDSFISEVYQEKGSDSIMIIRTDYRTGTEHMEYYPIPAWTTGEKLVTAAKKVFNLSF